MVSWPKSLARRRAAGTPPFTVLCCDNLPANGATLHRLLIEFADAARCQARRKGDAALAEPYRRRGGVSVEHGRSHRAGDHRCRPGADRR